MPGRSILRSPGALYLRLPEFISALTYFSLADLGYIRKTSESKPYRQGTSPISPPRCFAMGHWRLGVGSMAVGTYGDSYFCKAWLRRREAFPYILYLCSCRPTSFLPCVNFFSEMAQENESLLQGVLDTRFPEMVLWLFNEKLEDACNRTFTVLSTSLTLQDRWVDYTNPYCPDGLPTSLAKLLRPISANGGCIECHLLEKHAGAMLEVSWPVRKAWSQNMISHIVQNLEPFISSTSEPDLVLLFPQPINPLSTHVRWTFLRCETATHLSCLSYQGKIVLLTCIIGDLVAPFISRLHSPTIFRLTATRANTVESFSRIVQFLLGFSKTEQAPILSLSPLLPTFRNPWLNYRLGSNVRSQY
ncbi:hypothetical protein C8J57DRAFT_1339614, partial [Mycena rebaudengoi]